MYLLTDARRGRRAGGPRPRRLRRPRHPRAGALPERGRESSTAADALAAAGVTVRWAPPRFSFTHAKALIVDHARLAVMTLNLTAAGLERQPRVRRDRRRPRRRRGRGGGVLRPTDSATSRRGRAPRHLARHEPDGVRGLIAGATVSLAIETEELTDPGIVAALLAARARGVGVTLVWPGPPDTGASFAKLAAAGATVRAVAAPADPREGRGRRRPAGLPRLGQLHARRRSTAIASSACGSTTPPSPAAWPRPSPTTRPAASRRRRYIAQAWPTNPTSPSLPGGP